MDNAGTIEVRINFRLPLTTICSHLLQRADVMPRLNPRILDADKDSGTGARVKYLDFTDLKGCAFFVILILYHSEQPLIRSHRLRAEERNAVRAAQ